jgi:transcriptional regulator with XRE-family HTH domain
VNNWEKGRSRPDVSFLPAIVKTLGVTFEELYGLEDAKRKAEQRRTEADEKILSLYHRLDAGDQFITERMMRTMLLARKGKEQQENRPIIELPLVTRPLAAGIGDPTEFDEATEPFCLFLDSVSSAFSKTMGSRWSGQGTDAIRSRLQNGNYMLFHVNGESMEPEYPDGCYVLVEKSTELQYGKVGAFSSGNELYIKIYERDGLHSIHPSYPVMTFGEERCYLIGRVVCRIEELPTQEEIKLYKAVSARE